jgi:hypothetical protein
MIEAHLTYRENPLFFLLNSKKTPLFFEISNRSETDKANLHHFSMDLSKKTPLFFEISNR